MRRRSAPPGGWKRLLRTRLTVLIACAVFLAVSFTLGRELLRRQTVSRDVERLQAEISSLEQQNTDLEQLLAYLKSPTYLEAEARLKLGLKKSGESVIAVPATDSSVSLDNIDSDVGAAQRANPPDSESNPSKWWRYLWRQLN